ncbi:tetratricopeptide repeat protein, partial [candidate division KSB1 bacterium]|nr:tetratricopeptide repeat protein [candidate division KSB1 bacterium]
IAFRQINELNKSLDCLDSAYNIDIKFFGARHPYIARILMEIGIVFWKKNNSDSAIKHLQEAQQIYQASSGTTQAELAINLDYLGLIFGSSGYYEEALQNLEQAQKLKNEIYSERHPEIARTLLYLGKVYLNMGKRSLTEKLFKEALQICDKKLERQNPLTQEVVKEMEMLSK